MIKVKRLPEPQCLVENGRDWTAEYLAARSAWESPSSDANLKVLKQNKDLAERRYNQPEVKQVLTTMFHGKCAFCESAIAHIAYPHIEHYRPKDLEPQLCFDWNNLLLACSVCNGKQYKSNKFPLTDQGEAILNPCEDDPDEHLSFICEPDEFTALNMLTVVRSKSQRGEITIETLGLNRISLLKHRNEKLLPYFVYVAEKARDGDATAKGLLIKACQAQFEFAAFARTLWKTYLGEDPF
jgi:uncharacterized protein (TIGR02646 family)